MDLQQIEKSLFLLSKTTGYPIQSKNGQRIYGPPKELQDFIPPAGSEIFIGKLPRTIFENDLVPLFGQIGCIYQMRLMMEFSGKNRGYAFICYMDPLHAKIAVQRFHNYRIKPKCNIGVYHSIDNRKLYVGGLPIYLLKDEIEEKFQEVLEDVVAVILPGKNNGYNHQGYVFLQFQTHRAAAIARREIANIGVLWNKEVKVDWADPEPQVDPEIMYSVTKLHLRNLPLEMHFNELWEICEHIIPPGYIKHIFKSGHYAFLEFVNRCAAERGFVALQGIHICNQEIEVAWARPTEFSKRQIQNRACNHLCVSVPYNKRRLVYMNKERVTGAHQEPHFNLPIRQVHSEASSSGTQSPPYQYQFNYSSLLLDEEQM